MFGERPLTKLEVLRWIAIIIVIPSSWYACIVLGVLLQRLAVKIWCAEDEISGACPHEWFSQIEVAIIFACTVIGALVTVVVPYIVAPNFRVAAMWIAFTIGWFVLIQLAGFLDSLPAAAGALAISALLTWRAMGKERSEIRSSSATAQR
jgi:hypothetical protein